MVALAGVKEEVVEKALHQAGRFWNKAVELQQVVDESTKNFKVQSQIPSDSILGIGTGTC